MLYISQHLGAPTSSPAHEPGAWALPERAKPFSATPRRANSGLRGSPGEIPRTGPPARRGAPDPAPAYFATVAHTKEAVPQHLHGAGPGGVDERPSEDVRQGRHPGSTHVSGGAQRAVGGRRRARRPNAARTPWGCGPLPSRHPLRPRPAPASPRDRLPPAGRAQGLASCLLDANRICLPCVGSSLSLLPCFSF